MTAQLFAPVTPREQGSSWMMTAMFIWTVPAKPAWLEERAEGVMPLLLNVF